MYRRLHPLDAYYCVRHIPRVLEVSKDEHVCQFRCRERKRVHPAELERQKLSQCRRSEEGKTFSHHSATQALRKAPE